MGARDIAAALGKARREGRGWRTICPVHNGLSLNLADGRDGKLLVKCWAGCDPIEVLQEIGRRDFEDDDWRPDREDNRHDDDDQRREGAREIWRKSRDGRHALKPYLSARGITLAPPPSLRFLPAAQHRPTGRVLPAMVAKVVNSDGELTGIHRTFLRPDGRAKAEVNKDFQRMSLGLIKGGVVCLAPFDPSCALIVGEGIETVLSLMQMRDLPGWAGVSSSVLKYLVLPKPVQKVLIAVDHDRNGAGQRAARAAGQRWVAEGRHVWLAMPDQPGTDWNDILQRGICNG